MKSPLTRLNPSPRRLSRASSGSALGCGLAFSLAILVFTSVSYGQSNQCVAVPSGLIGWWSAEGNATDFTGEHSGTFPFGSAFTAGEVGQAFDFDGSLRRVSIADSPAFQLTNAMTLEAWVYPRAYGGFITFRGDNRGGLDTWVIDTYDTGYVKFQIDDEANNYQSVRAPLALNQWQHVAATWDRASGAIKIYVNGVLAQQTNTSVIPIGVLDSGSEPAIGIGNHGGTFHQFPFNGLIDELGIYNRALASNEIAAIYIANSAGKCITTNPPPAACVTPPPGLVSWWRGEQNATDALGTNSGAALNGVRYTNGPVGTAFYFDGVDDRVIVPNSASLNFGTGDFSIEAWIKPEAAATAFGVQSLVNKRYTPNSFAAVGWEFGLIDGKLACQLADAPLTGGDFSTFASASPDLRDGNYHHVALSIQRSSSTGGKLLVDGQVVLTFDPTSQPGDLSSTEPLRIGAHADASLNSHFTGAVDELSIYNRALTIAELQAIYNGGSAGKCPTNPQVANCTPAPSNVVGWWPAEGNPNDVVANHNGVLAGAVSYSSGKIGQAFSFNSALAAVVVPASPSLNVGSGAGLTLEAWINPTDVTQAYPLFEWNDATYWGVHFYIAPGQPTSGSSGPPGPGQLYANVVDSSGGWHQMGSASGAVSSNVFQHVALTYDKASGVATIYRNGAIVSQLNLGSFTPLTTYDLYLGRRQAPSAEAGSFAGLMDEPTVYGRALSQAEVQAIYNAGSAGKCSPTNPPVTCVPSSSDLVGWWRADSNTVDVIAGNSSVAQGAISYTAGRVGQAFSFDGSDAGVRIAASPVLDVGMQDGFTAEAWIYPTDVTAGRPIVEWSQDTGGSPYGAHLWAGHPSRNPGYFFANIADTQGNWRVIDKEGALVANSYQHVAVTYNRITGIARLFVNGAMVQEANLGVFTPRTSDNLYIGRRPPGDINSRSFAGQIDEVSIYRRALTPEELLAIYNAGSAGKCPPQFSQPSITQQPQSVTTNVSATVRFDVAATGVPSPTYQWFFGNAPLANQTNAALLLSNVQPAHAGLYSVQVSNVAGATVSSNALLTVDLTQPAWLVSADSLGFYNDSLGTTLDGTAPQFPIPFGSGGGDPEFYPADEPNLSAGAAILGNWLTNPASLNSYWRSVTSIPTTWELNTETAIIYAVDGGAHGVSNLRADIDADNGIYVWVNGQYKFGARQPGLPSPLGQYEYTNVFLGELAPGSNYIQILREDSGIADGYQFRLSGIVLATNQPPIITQSPATQTAIGGNTVSFNAAAIGSPALTFQWQFNGLALAGQSNTSLTLSNLQLAQAGAYTFVAANPYGSATSSVATLTVLAFPPVITRQPTNVIAIESTAASFSVQATGSVTLAYQWLFNNQPLAGKTAASLAFTSVQFSNAGNYSVIVTNPYGAVTSSVATLTVNPRPPCVPAPDGLVSWWRAENNALDGWDSNNGQFFLSRYVAGKVGLAFSQPLVHVPDAPSLRFTNAMTFEAWINPSSLTGSTPRTIISKLDTPLSPTGTQNSFIFCTTNNGALFFAVSPNGSYRTNTAVVTTNVLPINQWTHVAATYDGAALRIFINGSVAAERIYTNGIFPGTLNISLGGISAAQAATSSPWQFSGLMDEASLYNRALSLAEIQSIFAADLTGKCLAPPVITQQPQSQAVPLGEDVKLTATVVGSRPLTYRWKLNGTNIFNGTNAFLLIEKIKANQAGLYSLAVTNSAGFDISATAQISLLPAPSCTEILPGLISWWTADTNTLDVMGLNNINAYSPASYPTGKVASAFTFNGINSRVQINNSASLNFTNNQNFSIELWVKANPTNATFANVPLLEKRDAVTSGWRGYSLSLNSGRLAFSLAAVGLSNSNFVSSGPDLRDGMFHHVAVTLNRTNNTGGVLYVDGAPVLVFDPRAHTNSLLNTTPLFIGAPAITFSDSYFSGLIDEPAIYARTLTAAEILSIRTAGAAGRCKAPPIILTQPLGGIVAQGSNFTLTVAATGNPAPRYQWRRNTAPVNGATNATLNLINITSANAGNYSVIVSNAFGSVLSSNAVVALNRLPIANADALTTPSNTPAVFPAAKLTLNDTDADGDPLTVTTVSANSAQNGTVSLVSGMVTYSPPANFVGNDTFTYTVGDGRGGTATGTVMATVGSGGAAPLNIVFGPVLDAGQFVVRFAGIPGLTYTIESAPTLNGGWTKAANVTAPVTDTGLGIGVFEFRESVTGEGSRYYRTVYPSY